MLDAPAGLSSAVMDTGGEVTACRALSLSSDGQLYISLHSDTAGSVTPARRCTYCLQLQTLLPALIRKLAMHTDDSGENKSEG